jgi:hypothetical protein
MIKILAIFIFSAQSLLAQSRNHEQISDSSASHGQATTDAREEKIISRLLRIPEIKQRNRFIDSVTKHEHGISFLTLKRPTTENDYYWIQAGYNGQDRFEAYYNFYVYLPKLSVKILDPVSNKVYSLAAWREKVGRQ